MENITFDDLLLIINNRGLNMTWCDHDKWTVKRALGYIEELSAQYPADIRIIDYGNIIEIFYKDKLIQRYIAR